MTADRQRREFTALVQKHDKRLRSVAFRLLGGDAARLDDVMQEAYLRAFRAFGGFRGDAEVTTWLHRIVYNACVDELRRAQRRPAAVSGDVAGLDVASAGPGPERVVESRDVVLRALRALPAEQRATVVLVDGEGLDNLTVAHILGVAPGTVASRLSRARGSVRAALAKEER